MLVETFDKSLLTRRDLTLYKKTVLQNPYVRYKPYRKQSWAVFILNRPYFKFKVDEEYVRKPNRCLVGAGGYGGKTYLGAVLAAQYLQHKQYKCLVTRLNYDDLTDEDSIFGYLNEWCGENSGLPDELICDINYSKLKLKSPAGAVVTFRAFNHKKKKSKIRSKSYHRIVNDESSESLKEVLSFQPRSLRRSRNSLIPLSIADLSNPSAENPETNDYLIEKYVDGPYPYIPLDWRDNPYINKEEYSATLDDLDYVDQQYQKYGDWHYKPAVGDLITRDEAEAQFITKPKYGLVLNVIGIDLAGKGKDKFAVCSYNVLSNGYGYVEDLNQTDSAYPEDMLYDFVLKHNPLNRHPKTSLILIEQEPGGSPLYAERHFETELADLINERIPMMLLTPKGNKYQRARPCIRDVRHGTVYLNRESAYINDFIDEMIMMDPLGKGRSPNLVDSWTLAKNYVDNEILTLNGSGMQTARV